MSGGLGPRKRAHTRKDPTSWFVRFAVHYGDWILQVGLTTLGAPEGALWATPGASTTGQIAGWLFPHLGVLSVAVIVIKPSYLGLVPGALIFLKLQKVDRRDHGDINIEQNPALPQHRFQVEHSGGKSN